MKSSLLSFSGLLLAALALTLSRSASASPIPITGSISFLGNATVNTGDLATATSFTSFDTDTVNQTSGAYLAVPALTGDPVTFPATGFTFRSTAGTSQSGTLFSSMPVAAPLTTLPLWTFTTAAGVTYDFSAMGTINVTQNSQFLNISGQGIADITGGGTNFAATDGQWTIQETNTGAAFSFGATSGETAPAPDGTATSLLISLGLAGVGLGLFGQRRILTLAM
jgi:hypothetical protein